MKKKVLLLVVLVLVTVVTVFAITGEEYLAEMEAVVILFEEAAKQRTITAVEMALLGGAKADLGTLQSKVESWTPANQKRFDELNNRMIAAQRILLQKAGL
jgi:peptidoglycan hydrolase CwlO-like protein